MYDEFADVKSIDRVSVDDRTAVTGGNDEGNLTLKNIFQGAYKIFGENLKTTLIQKASEMPEVQEAIEQEKLKVGKNITWQIMPFVLIVGVLAFLIARFK